MANKLKNMKLTSVDLCKRGANPQADIKLFKSTEHGRRGEVKVEETKENFFTRLGKSIAKAMGAESEEFFKEAKLYGEIDDLRECTEEIYRTTYALQESLLSIVNDREIDQDEKVEMLTVSIHSFFADAVKNIPDWAKTKARKSEVQGKKVENQVGKVETKKSVEEEVDLMALINVEKMSAEDRAVLEALDKKYQDQSGEEVEKKQELHPEVKKALDEMENLKKESEELKKSLEIKDLETICKKYEVLGKNSSELATKLYDLKKAGESFYNDYISLLDEQENIANSGIFKEFGSNRSGDKLSLTSIVSEIMKSEPTITREKAVIKAYEMNPDLDPYTGESK